MVPTSNGAESWQDAAREKEVSTATDKPVIIATDCELFVTLGHRYGVVVQQANLGLRGGRRLRSGYGHNASAEVVVPTSNRAEIVARRHAQEREAVPIATATPGTTAPKIPSLSTSAFSVMRLLRP